MTAELKTANPQSENLTANPLQLIFVLPREWTNYSIMSRIDVNTMRCGYGANNPAEVYLTHILDNGYHYQKKVILPKDGKKVFFDGKEYPYANHCTCRTCRRSYSSVTHTVLNIPSSYIQFASRVPYPQHGTAQEPSASSSHTSDATLPPSCAVSSIGNLRSGNVRRLSTTSTISTVSATSTSSLTTAFTLSSRTSIATAASGSSSVSSSNSAPPLTRRVSFVEVDTPLGCCSATSMEPSPAIAPPPLLPEMLITPPRPAYYSPLAAEARRNPNSTTRYSGSGTSSIPRPSGVTTRMANASQVGGGVENSFFASSNSTVSSRLPTGKGKTKASPGVSGTINPFAAIVPLLKQQKEASSLTSAHSTFSSPSSPSLSSAPPPSYSPFPQQQQQPGVSITSTLTIPWPYKEYPISENLIRGFCGYCGGGLLTRQ
ncbi:hypothetical protein BDZ91DRAFT_786215, partial [Kalaharituber pfeilii]